LARKEIRHAADRFPAIPLGWPASRHRDVRFGRAGSQARVLVRCDQADAVRQRLQPLLDEPAMTGRGGIRTVGPPVKGRQASLP